MSIAQTADVAMLETREASPSHFLMRVESYSLLSKNGIHKYESGEFTAGGHKWRLILYPNEDKNGRRQKCICVLGHLGHKATYPLGGECCVLHLSVESDFRKLSLLIRNKAVFSNEVGMGHFQLYLQERSDGSIQWISNGNNCVFGAEVFIVEKTALSECLSVKNEIVPFKRDWKISNLSELGELWTSEKFVAGGVKWKVEVWPKGNGVGKDRCLSAFLCLVDSRNTRVNARFSINIRDQINNTAEQVTTDSHWFSTTSGSTWGWSQFVELATLEDPKNGFIVKDYCLLEIEIFVLAVV